MTGFLASVRDAAEAGRVLEEGVDILDVKEPARGALGAVDAAALQAVLAAVRGAVPVSATIGDLPPVPEMLAPAIRRTWSAGVDIVKVGVFSDGIGTAVQDMLCALCRGGVRVVLVLFAEFWRDDMDFESVGRAGVTGVMLDTRDKCGGSLRDKLGDGQLREFVRRARAAGLMNGLAGSLREADIPPLLALAPDYLGFRGALCAGAGRDASVDARSVRGVARHLRTPGRAPAPLLTRRQNMMAEVN
jgi:uncharacterized protein (UPF0264 family)